MIRRTLLPALGRAVALLSALLALAGAPLSAQSQSGNLYGSVTDDQGAPLPGVNVTLTGAAPQTQVSDERGGFRFVGLSPGSYGLKAELDGFSPIDYPAIAINIGRNTEITVTMNAAVTDVITVTTESPLLDKSRIAVTSTVAQTELESIPTSRDPWAILGSTPGVNTDRVNVGGSETGQQAQYVGPGSHGDQAVWSVDGVVITDMAALGSSPAYYDFDSFEEMQVTTGGSDAATSTGGVVLNMVTKRGTNDFRGSSRYIFGCGTDANGDTKGAQCFTNMQGNLNLDAGELGQAGPWNRPSGGSTAPGNPQQAFSQGNKIQSVEDYGVEFGGPIVRDRFWFWGAIAKGDIDLLTISNVRDHTILDTTNLKLNGQISQANSITASAIQSDKVKIGRNAGPLRPQPTTWNQSKFGDDPTSWKIEDTHVFSPNFYLSGMYSVVNGGFQLIPQGGLTPTNFLDITGAQSFTTVQYQTARPQDQIKLDGSQFFSTGEVNHELKFGVGHREADVESLSVWGGAGLVAHERYYGTAHPVLNLARDANAAVALEYDSAYVQDTLTRGNLTVNLGVNYSKQGGTLLATEIGANRLLPNLFPGTSFDGGAIGFEWQDITPRLGLTYALGAERKTLLRGSYSRFADQLGAGNAFPLHPLSLNSYLYFYTDVRGSDNFRVSDILDLDGNGIIDLRDSIGNSGNVNPANFSNAINNRIDPNYSAPLTDEVLLSLEHALRPELVIGLNLTYRKLTGITESETLVFDDDNPFSPTNIVRTGRPHQASDYTPLTFTDTLPNGEVVSRTRWVLKSNLSTRNGVLVENGDREQEYKGGAVTFTKRLANRWMMRGNFSFSDFTWSSLPSSELEDPTSVRGVGSVGGVREGDEVIDRVAGSGKGGGRFINAKWSYSVNGLYQVAPDRPWAFNVAASVSGRQGYPTPYFRQFSLGANQQFAAQRVLLTDDATRFRLDDVQTVDLRVEKEFVLRDLSLTVGLDLFNALNESTVLFREPRLAITTGDHVQEVLSPRIFRAGVRLSLR